MEPHRRPTLIVFGGLPGTGKTTVSKALAARLGAVYLRIDAIEQAMQAAGAERIGPAAYTVANALSLANLQLGHAIVVDCVNPVRDSRRGWQNVAAQAAAVLVDIHLVCSDTAEHRRRVEGRVADIPGLVLPTWEAVMKRSLDPRDDDHLLLDTAGVPPDTLTDRCEAYVASRQRNAMPQAPRPATPEDLQSIQALIHAAYNHYIARIGRQPGPMLDDYAALIGQGHVHVIEHEGAIKAVLVLLPQEGSMLLDNVAVSPDAQGLGLGRRMLDFAEQAAMAAGYRSISLYTNEAMTENVGLYARIGYVETHRAEEKGLRRIYMQKALGGVTAPAASDTP